MNCQSYHSWPIRHIRLLGIPFILLVSWGVTFHSLTAAAQSGPVLSAQTGRDGRMLLNSSVHPGSFLTLDSSTNLLQWSAAAVLHDGIFAYPDLGSEGASMRFFRATARPRSVTDDWKNQITYPGDPFEKPAEWGGVSWLKFAILLDAPSRVYYQDSTAYPFHYDFAVERLPKFAGMDRVTFDSVSLFRTNQQVVLGAVLAAPTATAVEYGIQFAGFDTYTPEQIAQWFSLVKATVYSSNGAGVFYIPTYEQSEVARTNKAAFDALGVPVASVERWIPGDHAYAPGWALGRLKYFSGTAVADAFADGRLTPADILLTDGVPAETPLVAGIISLRPSTPNSHTAILAISFGIPFVHFPDADEQDRLMALIGRKVILRAAVNPFGGADVDVFDIEGQLSSEDEAQLLALKEPRPIGYLPKELFGAFYAPVDALTPADIRFFGGKAANYGFLRRAVRENAPPAIAFSFDLWDAFMEQTLSGSGRTLRETIAAELAPYTNYPPDIASLKQSLANVRGVIRGDASFNAEQRAAITNALTVFDAHRKIRFRSSTNVEDSEHFTGAGLYDSYSGCLLDDLDGDTAGPSHCDPGESGERGVFRAIQRVFASFYNDNAFLERLRHGVNEAEVAMGVLVHHSFPDPDELANGVAKLEWRFTSFSGDMVTQKGAVSVTNPDGSSSPEVVQVEGFKGVSYLTLRRHSSLVPLGDHVLTWESEYKWFVALFQFVAEEFKNYYPAKTIFTLDFEYKKDRLLGLVVKQVREVPPPFSDGPGPAFLVNAPSEWVVYQGEAGDVFSNHRLKTLWNIESRNMWLMSTNLANGIYLHGSVQYLENGTVTNLTGPLASWPDAFVSPDGTTNSWSTGSGTNGRQWELRTAFSTQSIGGEPPIFVPDDFSRQISVQYNQPVPTLSGYPMQPASTSHETALLEPRRKLTPPSIYVERMVSTNEVEVATSFYWPEPPTGVVAGYTAPLVHFVNTRITGLISSPITLTNYYSQTYRPGHHNFSEEFIFEPGLEPGLSPDTRAELEAANVKLLYVHWSDWGSFLKILGRDGKFRDAP
jgi:hypothetical protein